MGAPKKYHTEEERLAAKRQQNAAAETKRRRAAGMAEKKVYATDEERIAADLESKRKYREANKDRINAQTRLSRAAQRERGEGTYAGYLADMTPERRAELRTVRKEYYSANREKIKVSKRASYLKKAELYVWKTIKKRAEKSGIPFNIEVSDVVAPEFCPVLGIRLQRLPGLEMRDEAPSVDRLIPELGYVKGNVIVISFRANRIKNDATIEELQKVANFYETLLYRSDLPISKLNEEGDGDDN